MKKFTKMMTDCYETKLTMVYQTPIKDGELDTLVGDIVAISKDNCRTYIISDSSVKHEGQRIVIIPSHEDEEIGWSGAMLCRHFVAQCEEVTLKGYATVWQKTIVDAMVELSDKLDLGWVTEEYYDSDTMEEGYRVYSKWFAEKAFIGQNVIFCFSEESLVEIMAAESISSFCDFKKHEVIMECPSGNFISDEAYVIIRDKLITIVME